MNQKWALGLSCVSRVSSAVFSSRNAERARMGGRWGEGRGHARASAGRGGAHPRGRAWRFDDASNMRRSDGGSVNLTVQSHILAT